MKKFIIASIIVFSCSLVQSQPFLNESSTFQLWQSASNDWKNSFKTETSFIGNKQNYELNYNWSNNSWVLNTRNSYTFNSSGYETTMEKWANNSYTNISKNIYENNSSGLLETHTYQQWVNNQWRNNSKYTYEYDANNNNINYINYDWDTINNVWENSSKTINAFDCNNNKTQTENFSWNGTNWENFTMSTLNYDANNKLQSIVSEVFYNSTWNYSSMQTYSYNNSGNIESVLNQNFGQNGWYNQNQYEYFYDSNLNLEELSIKKWNSTSSTFENNYRYIYTYIQGVAGIDKNENELEINVFPNPASESITLITPFVNKELTLNIIDIEGKTIASTTTNNGCFEIKIGTLKKGSYIYSIIGNSGIFKNGTFIKD